MIKYNGRSPYIEEGVFIAPGSVIIGDVYIGSGSSVFFQCVLRGDINHIKIGRDTNIQDGAIIHVGRKFPVNIGNNVVVGHGAIVHGCNIGDLALIGMGAKLLNGSIVEDESIVAAGSVVKEGQVVKSGYLYAGVPARQIRKLTSDEIKYIKETASSYQNIASEFDRLVGEYRFNF